MGQITKNSLIIVTVFITGYMIGATNQPFTESIMTTQTTYRDCVGHAKTDDGETWVFRFGEVTVVDNPKVQGEKAEVLK